MGRLSQRISYADVHQVALKKLVDDISVLAVEHCLLDKLTTLFQAETVLDLSDEEVKALAQESDESAARRWQCTVKMDVLDAGMDDLKRLDAHRSLSTGMEHCGLLCGCAS